MNAAIYIHAPLNSHWTQYQEREKAEAYVKAHQDLKTVMVYADYGPFDPASSNSALFTMLRDAGTGIFKVLVIKAPKQLSKEPAEALEIYRYLKNLEVQVLFYNGTEYPIDYWLRQYERMCKCRAT